MMACGPRFAPFCQVEKRRRVIQIVADGEQGALDGADGSGGDGPKLS